MHVLHDIIDEMCVADDAEEQAEQKSATHKKKNMKSWSSFSVCFHSRERWNEAADEKPNGDVSHVANT